MTAASRAFRLVRSGVTRLPVSLPRTLSPTSDPGASP